MGLARGSAADNVSCRCAGLTAVLILCIAVAVGLFIFIAGMCVIQRSETDAVLHCRIFDMHSQISYSEQAVRRSGPIFGRYLLCDVGGVAQW